MSLKQQVIQAIEPIIDGSTHRIDCPRCNGDRTFTATVEGDCVVYNCYRSACSAKGKFYLQLSVEERFQHLRNKHNGRVNPIREFICPPFWVDGVGNSACVDYMRQNHLMQAYEQKLFRPMYDPAERRFVFPIRGSNGSVIGGVGRTLIGANPKVLNYNANYNIPFMCGVGRKYSLLVEDCASAVAATRHPDVAGVAMLGTHLKDEFIPHLSPYQWVAIALDPDAYSKSLRMKTHLTSYLKDVRVLKLPDDVKNMDDESYMKMIGELLA